MLSDIYNKKEEYRRGQCVRELVDKARESGWGLPMPEALLPYQVTFPDLDQLCPYGMDTR